MSDPAVKTPSFLHQQEIYDQHRNDQYFGLLWEMGLGKTKTLIDIASHLFLTKQISGLLICAPNSVYSNWITQELPAHMAAPYVKLLFNSGEKGDKARMRRQLFLSPDYWHGKLRVLCMSYDGVKTEHGEKLAHDFILLYRTMIVADESTALKNGSTVTAKTMKRLRTHCTHAWIATGTPIAQSPFDIHSQIEFLCPTFWRNLGMKSISAFHTHFGVYALRRAGGRVFNELQGYREMETLGKMIQGISSRLLKEDSTVKLPPKLYKTVMFKLHSEQRRIYDELRKNYETELDAGGGVIEAPLAIVRLTRLQQIASGFVTAEDRALDLETENWSEIIESTSSDEDYEHAMISMELEMNENTVVITRAEPSVAESRIVDVISPSENPRLKLLVDLVAECSHKVIVWCRFKRDVDNVCNSLGDVAVRYDGIVGRREREAGLVAFRDPVSDKRVFVANVHSISQGVTLTIAKTMIYYSNSFSPERRLQSEDRFHRIGQDSSVLIIDLVAEDTVDERLIETLREKYDLSARVMGDRFREWIKPIRREE